MKINQAKVTIEVETDEGILTAGVMIDGAILDLSVGGISKALQREMVPHCDSIQQEIEKRTQGRKDEQ